MKWNKELAYFLGFFWADGYLWSDEKSGQYRIVLENVSEDLESILPFFESIGHFSLFRRWRPNSTKEVLRATMYNKKLYKWLMANGYDNKLSSHSVLAVIPKKYQNHFWRGLFDGDGCFGIYKRKTRNSTDYRCELVSDIEQDWSSLARVCKQLKIKHSIYKRTNPHNFSSFYIGRIDDMIKFGRFLYRGASLVQLERKYKKFLQIKTYARLVR